jgi:hypothetical protein
MTFDHGVPSRAITETYLADHVLKISLNDLFGVSERSLG